MKTRMSERDDGLNCQKRVITAGASSRRASFFSIFTVLTIASTLSMATNSMTG